MSEQYEMPVFDAMAFAQAYFYFRNRKRLSEERKPFYAAGKERRGQPERQHSAGSKVRGEFG